MSILLQGIDVPEGNPRTINLYRDGTWVDAYTTEDGMALQVSKQGEQAVMEIKEQEEWEDAMREEMAHQEMAQYFDENGDPYRDFLGNPW